MNNTSTLYGVIGFLFGIVLTVVVVNNQMYGMMRMMGMGGSASFMERGMMGSDAMHGSGMDMSMNDMMSSLEGKTGDKFDKAFLAAMIEHHQGAIDMAKLIPAQAKHDEIKQLGEAIIKAQTQEIGDMKQWQSDWGY